MIINIDKPVYEKTETGYLYQILSFNTDNRCFKVKYMEKDNIVKESADPIDADRLSFDINGPWVFNPDVVEYLYGLGILRVTNISGPFRDVLARDVGEGGELAEVFDAYKSLLYKLIKIRNGIDSVNYQHTDKIFIADEDHKLATLCSSALILGGRPNWIVINELKKFKFKVFPLEADSFGWLVGGVDTDKGIITFG